MSKVTVSWGSNQPVQTLLVPGNTKVDISGGALTSPLSMSVAMSPAVFPDLAPNDPTQTYVATVQEFDNSATPIPIGSSISTKFNVPVPVPTVNAPSDIVVTVG